MNIENIQIGGFTNVGEVNLRLSSNICALIGLNGYGKSNVLAAIDFGTKFIEANEARKSRLMSLDRYVPLNKSTLSRNYFFNIDFNMPMGDINYCVKYGFEFQWKTDGDEPKIVSEFLKYKQDAKNKKYNLLINRKDLTTQYKSSQKARCDKNICIDDNQLIINKLKAFDDLFYIKIVKAINAITTNVDANFNTEALYCNSPITLKDIDLLDIDRMVDIPRVVHQISKQSKDMWELLKYSYMQLFPEISDIQIQEIPLNGEVPNLKQDKESIIIISNNVYSMVVQDDRLVQQIDFSQLSDGARRVFTMLTVTVIASMKGYPVIFLEEPENCMHPMLLKNFLNILSQIAENCKIVISSHSPFLLQYLDLSSIYVGIPNDQGLAKFSKIAKSKVKTLLKEVSEMDITVGEYVFNLMSDDSDCIDILSKYLESFNDK